MRLGRLGNKLHCAADCQDGSPKNGSAQDSSPLPRDLHCNSVGGRFQEEGGGPYTRGKVGVDLRLEGEGIGLVQEIIYLSVTKQEDTSV